VVDTLPVFLLYSLLFLLDSAGKHSIQEAAGYAVDLLKLITHDDEIKRLRPSERSNIRLMVKAMRDIGSIAAVIRSYLSKFGELTERERQYADILVSLSTKLIELFPHMDGYRDKWASLEDVGFDLDSPGSKYSIVPEPAKDKVFDTQRLAGNADLHQLKYGWDEGWQKAHEAVTVLTPAIMPDAIRENWGSTFRNLNRELATVDIVPSGEKCLKYLSTAELLKSLVLAKHPMDVAHFSLKELGIDMNTWVWRRFVPTRRDSYSRGKNLTSQHERTEDDLDLAIPELLKENLAHLVRLRLICENFRFEDYCTSLSLDVKATLLQQKKAICDQNYMPTLGLDQFREQLPLYATAMNFSLSEVYWCTSEPHHQSPIGDHYEEGEGEILSRKYNELVNQYFRGES